MTEIINKFLPSELLTDFDISRLILNIPILLFDFFLAVIFLLALRAVLIIIFSKKELKVESGKRNLYASFFWFFLLLVCSFIFSSITFLLGGSQGRVTQAGEFPVFLASDFPSGPEYLKIGDYYFSRPLLLASQSQQKKGGVGAISCKEGEKYVIISIIGIEEKENPLLDKQYSCWLLKCGDTEENLYFSLLNIFQNEYKANKITEISQQLNNQLNLSCQSS